MNEELYLLHKNNAGDLANLPMFWAEKGGFTPWIDEAKRLNSYEVFKQMAASTEGEDQWTIWPVGEIETFAKRTCDIQALREFSVKKHKAALDRISNTPAEPVTSD